MKYKLTIWYQRLTWCVCELKQKLHACGILTYTVHVMFCQSVIMIFTSSIHCSSVVDGESLTWSVLPTADTAPVQELLNGTQWKIKQETGWRWNGPQKKQKWKYEKGRARYNQHTTSPAWSLWLHQFSKQSNNQQFRKASYFFFAPCTKNLHVLSQKLWQHKILLWNTKNNLYTVVKTKTFHI